MKEEKCLVALFGSFKVSYFLSVCTRKAWRYSLVPLDLQDTPGEKTASKMCIVLMVYYHGISNYLWISKYHEKYWLIKMHKAPGR